MPGALGGTQLAVKRGQWEQVVWEQKQGGVTLGRGQWLCQCKDDFLSPLEGLLSHGLQGRTVSLPHACPSSVRLQQQPHRETVHTDGWSWVRVILG